MTVTLDDIRDAHRLLESAVERTPTLASRTLSAISVDELVGRLTAAGYAARNLGTEIGKVAAEC